MGRLKAYLSQAILADSVRGYHSTGIMALPKKEDQGLVTYKEAVPGYTFIDTKGYNTILSNLDSYKFVIAHNRWATKGSVNYDNSHPFVHGNIAMVHNGTLKSRYQLPSGTKFEVDSEDVCYNLSDSGTKETIKNLNGAFAIASINTEDRTLELFRNEERPLHFATLKGIDATIIASEEDMLTWIAGRCNLPIEYMYDLSPGYVLTFSDKVREYEGEEVELYTPPKPERSSYTASSGNSSQRYSQTGKVLKGLGLEKGQVVGFHSYEYRPYASGGNGPSAYGKMVGYLIEPVVDQYVEVNISGMHKEVYKTLKKQGESLILEGRINYGRELDVQGFEVPVLELDTRTLEVTAFDVKDSEEYIASVKAFKELDKETDPKVVDIAEGKNYLRGPGGVYIPRNKWEELVGAGCSLCGNAVAPITSEFVTWEGDEPICEKCSDEMGVAAADRRH